MSETISHAIDDDTFDSWIEGDKNEREELVKKLFCDLEDRQHECLLGGFIQGLRETYSGEVEVDVVNVETETEGDLGVKFAGSTHLGCRDVDGADYYSEAVYFFVNLDERKITFETSPPPPIDDRYDEI